MSSLDLATLTLNRGSHSSPDTGHCLMEAVSMFAGEPFSDAPQCVDPVLATFGRSWNDALRSDEEREQLKRYIPLLPDTNKGEALSRQRSWMAFDWLVRVSLPAWLELNTTLAEHAASLRALDTIKDQQGLDLARPALDQAARGAAAAMDGAMDAARDTARAAARDARAAAMDAARAALAAAEAARDAAGAAWDAALAAAGAAWDAAGDAWATAGDAAAASSLGAAWATAMDVAGDAAGDAARAAAGAVAWAGSRSNKRADAANAALAPTVALLQTSAHDLYLRMINAQPVDAS